MLWVAPLTWLTFVTAACALGCESSMPNSSVREEMFPAHPSNSSAGCPTAQLSSDTIYLETVSDSRGWGFSPLRLLLLAHFTSPGCHLWLWPTDCRWGVPMVPSFGVLNLLEWFAELKEAFYFWYHPLITKGYNSGTARWKRCTGQSMGKRPGALMPSLMPLPLDLCVFTHLEALQTLSLVFLWRLHYIDMIY